MDILEQTVLDWYNKSRYRRLGNDVSVTELLNPVQMVHLKNRHRPQANVTDLGTLMPALIGTGLHDQLQRYLKDEDRVYQNWQIERRLLGVIDGVRLSGRFDALYNNEILYDIKTTRCWKIEKGDYSDWENQLNIYDYLLYLDGIEIKELRIFAVLMDWSPGYVYKKGYPKSRTLSLNIDRWTRSDQEAFISTRVKIWKDSMRLPDEKLPECTAQDRWASAPEYRLYRLPMAKRAYKVFPLQRRATAYLKACQKKDPEKWKDGFVKADIKDQWKRCESYCDVRDFCHQYKNRGV